MDKKTSILVVDDDTHFRETLGKILIVKGFEVVTVDSGLSALDKVKEKAFDIILMDIKMPFMNGVEVFKKIKEIRPDSVVILMTAFSVDELIHGAIKEGAYAVMRKPFDIETMVNMISKARDGALVSVVDDDPEICRTMKAVLEAKGYSTVTCFSADEAISHAKERQYKLYFIDMKLPVLNGLELYLEIKKIDPQAVVVMMTAYRQEVDNLIKQALEKGAYTCLYKPFEMDEAIKIIEQIFQNSSKKD
ncbi:MAG: response regulator [Candidatus Omnitrophota bacterium]